ncbi:hypothetical protein [Bradyrhizobium sp. SZCCHNR2009]|uniref:hypothetical protein n=1 Tax=Bradyrhizobium sp. SZCCHNR2009 TaxID=3057375 RepID=UPI0028E432AE|nr:hypothetical protein [Bradyrhizobium sp. SZCCHNR2009]
MSKPGDLRKLSQQPMAQEHFAEMREQAFGEKNDRGACLLFAANLENALDAAITSWCFTPSEDVSGYFQGDGIFGTFSRKIASARAKRIIGPITTSNLTVIRHVRNAFAHAKIPIDFETLQISAICEDLIRINPMPPHAVLDKDGYGPRSLFSDVCGITQTQLFTIRQYLASQCAPIC